MTCDSYELKINAWIDGELPFEEQRELQVHLANCAQCKQLEQDLRSVHSQLQTHLEPMQQQVANLAASTIHELSKQPIIIARPSILRSGWLAVSAAAAGFLLAWLLLPRGIDNQSDPKQEVVKSSSTQPQLQLTIASGAVEVQKPSGEWCAVPTGGYVSCGVQVRTPSGSRCEFRTPEGSEVRLNHETQLVFDTPRQLKVSTGQVWSTVAKASTPYTVKIADTLITALGTQFDVATTAKGTTLSVLEGSTQVERAGQKTTVKSGQEWSNVGNNETQQDRESYQLLQATNWVHEILLLKGRDHPELQNRINDIMASIGRTKMDYLVEEEIRVLGDHAVIPLTRYLQSAKPSESGRRRKAAKLLADLAQPRSIGELITLLTDEDPNVRASIAIGLKRLTGQELGYNTQAWSSSTPMGCEPMQQRWATWWKENQYRCASEKVPLR
jgi:ferric-dicitrate binding protein FerR (iron transport regulator)